jgi:hypothetical protein
VIEDGGTINRAVVVMNARPALWDEVAREHAEALTRSLWNRSLLDWSVIKGLLSVMKVRPVTVLQTCVAADVCRASCFTC